MEILIDSIYDCVQSYSSQFSIGYENGSGEIIIATDDIAKDYDAIWHLAYEGIASNKTINKREKVEIVLCEALEGLSIYITPDLYDIDLGKSYDKEFYIEF